MQWTRWDRKLLAIASIITAILLFLGIGIAYKAADSAKLQLAGKTFSTEIVDTDAERAKGLSGRDFMGANNVMVFVFDNPKKRCFWMKDMLISIDMVWLDANKNVVGIEQNVSPTTYPKNFCYDNARYVLEFTAGTANKSGMKIGDKAQF